MTDSIKIININDEMALLEKGVEKCESRSIIQVLYLKNEIDSALANKEIEKTDHTRLVDDLNNQARYFHHYCKCNSLR